ncbi:vacuolar protein sorting vps16 [Anaeramoeba flamelloides]|uniref:Vacuolar protein sorting vps16 n=1 Tax=Anaeramoeba flamelloides TaxID=1746091 RepID=A0ABQ8XZ29_9EUKA|nr:vacuolar protein sorting vps16 [Anaeramoeba flamelloides]
MNNPSLTWNKFDRYFYETNEFYQMEWEDIDLSNYIVSASRFGGLLALILDDSKVIQINSVSIKHRIFIYTSSGVLISQIDYGNKKVKGVGWTLDERLLVVYEDCSVVIYDIFGEIIKTILMAQEKDQELVYRTVVWENGIVILTKKDRLILIESMDDPKIMEYNLPLKLGAVTAMEIILPFFTFSGHTEVLISTLDNKLYVLSEKSDPFVIDLDERIIDLVISPTGKLLAYYTANGGLFVVSTDFEKNYLQFNCNMKQKPRQICWCSGDTVLLNFEKNNLLLMVGPSQSYLQYYYYEPIHLITEVDGTRIITNTKCEFLRKVPEVIVPIFQLGVSSPAAYLYDASEAFSKVTSKGDETIRMILKKSELTVAVDTCLEAAGHSFSPEIQLKLMKAASLGKTYLDGYYHDDFGIMAKDLRVLNQVKAFDIGMCITYTQFKKMGTELLIERLINRKFHYIALKICECLTQSKDRVLVRWACDKVKSSGSDEDILNSIVSKLGGEGGISFASIASVAYSEGKKKLAIKILDYENSASQQVPLLINMEKPERALIKAIESGNADLIYLVLLHMINDPDYNESNLFEIVRNKKIAINLLVKYCKKKDPKFLIKLFSELKQPTKIGLFKIVESYQTDEFNEIVKLRNVSSMAFNSSKKTFFKKITDENIKFLNFQKQLEEKTPLTVIGKSINETLTILIKREYYKEAKKLKKMFSVPNERFWWVKMKALASKHRWKELYEFANNEKSPIGYQPFVDICIQNSVSDQALKYIPKIKDPLTKVKYYLKLKKFELAADVAISQKDQTLLDDIRNRAPKNLKIPHNI